MKKIATISSVLLAAALLLVIGRNDFPLFGTAKPPMNERPHLVGDRMKFVLGTTAFDIPAVYYKGGGRNHLKQLSSVHLWALLPHFEWYDSAKNRYEFLEERGFGRRLGVWLELTGPLSTMDTAFERRVAHWQSKGREYVPIGSVHGLQIYPGESKYRQEYVYRDGEQSARLFLRCIRDNVVPSPACKGRWYASKDVVVNITFHKRFLPQWKQIWLGVQELLDGKTPFKSEMEKQGE